MFGRYNTRNAVNTRNYSYRYPEVYSNLNLGDSKCSVAENNTKNTGIKTNYRSPKLVKFYANKLRETVSFLEDMIDEHYFDGS